RTGTMFACEQEAVAPDFLCLAKGLTGGYLPLAATLTTDEVYEAFLGEYAESKTFFHGHTYGGNPLGAAVALASLQVFDDEATLERLGPKIARLAQRLAGFARLPHVGDVRQRGLIAGIELVADKTTNAPYPWSARLSAAIAGSCPTAIPPERVVPLAFAEPLAPTVAARLLGGRLEPAEVERKIDTALAWWHARAEVLVVEGIGGLLTPLAEGM